MKKVAAYRIQGTVLLQAMSLTDTSLWIAHGEVLSIPADDPAGLASAIRQSLDHSIEDVAHPPQSEWKHIQRPILHAAGVKNWAALGKKAKAVGIEWAGDTLAFIPCVDFRHDGGEDSDEHTIHCGMDDARLGAKLLEAFEHAS
ncbi:hypothetical protein [Xanthomonas bundabergensis]|uniref:hypothetical protein n=1 Tax=Xanthomonas bundabergensis TaxID=3160842 RepID=UPI003519D61A